jgi:hypothetical protein
MGFASGRQGLKLPTGNSGYSTIGSSGSRWIA